MIKALEQISDIKYWLYGEESYNRTSFKRYVNIEHPCPNADFKKFKNAYDNCSENLLVLQGHPNAWKPKHFIEFIKIIVFLKFKNCEFIFTKDV